MNLYNHVWRLVPNKIVRYPGGRELDRFRGISRACDDNRPEAWIGSDTSTFNAKHSSTPYNGCSECFLPDGSRCYLFEAIAQSPLEALGQKHLDLHGAHIGVLVKLLDAQHQLGLQTHPTRSYAKEHFNSDYGKEECWYVIGLREDAAEPPYVLLGFKDGVTYSDFERGYDQDDITAMQRCCHKIQVEIGDLFFIRAGVPHAIGGGCFVVEVQEPSDITVGASRLPPNASKQDQLIHKERLLNCYIYDGSDSAENLKRYKITPKLIRKGEWGTEHLMIGQQQTSYFSFTRLEATDKISLLKTGFLQIAVILEGSGRLDYADGSCSVKKGDELFIPYSVAALYLDPGEQGISIVLCNPGNVTYPFCEK